MKAPLLLEALLQELKARKIPFKVLDQVKELYEITYREAFAEGTKDALGENEDEDI